MVGCAPSPSLAPGASASAVAAPGLSVPSAQTSATTPQAKASADLPAIALVRKKTPAEKFADDHAACDGGDAEACLRIAGRYFYWPHQGGCGVPRGERAHVWLRVGPEDPEIDRSVAPTYVEKACAAGDKRSCKPRLNWAKTEIEDAYFSLERAHPGFIAFVAEIDPKRAKFIRDLAHDQGGPPGTFYELPKVTIPSGAVPDAAVKICHATRDCDEIITLLDELGFDDAAIAPVRHASGEALADACLEGECGCGAAAIDLPPTDPRRLDLARFGCADGEADGCYALGRAYEEGWGIPKNPAAALTEYEKACPPNRRPDQADERSKLACDRLSQAYELGDLVPKSATSATFYAWSACANPGFERYQGPCVRLGRLLFAVGSQGLGRSDPDFDALGPGSEPYGHRECKRPSVAAECAAYQKIRGVVP